MNDQQKVAEAQCKVIDAIFGAGYFSPAVEVIAEKVALMIVSCGINNVDIIAEGVTAICKAMIDESQQQSGQWQGS